jgi:hypothetical protein
MNPEFEPQNLSDAEAFELLEHPESWPADPRRQAELAELLELHLALHAHLDPAWAAESAPDGRPVLPLVRRFPWLVSAAAALMVALPLAYHAEHVKYLAAMAQNQARIQDLAQKRGQDRLWAAFFEQTSTLIQDFRLNARVCDADKSNEDLSAQREMAFALLQASHKLAAQNAPGPDADRLRSDLHAWLMELSLEDGCLAPERANELRQWASSRNLEDEAQRLGQMLKEDPS